MNKPSYTWQSTVGLSQYLLRLLSVMTSDTISLGKGNYVKQALEISPGLVNLLRVQQEILNCLQKELDAR